MEDFLWGALTVLAIISVIVVIVIRNVFVWWVNRF